MTNTTERRPLLDAAGAAEYLGTTERHVRRLAWERKIAKVKLGGKLRFDPAKLDEYVARHTAEAEDA